MFLAYTDKNHVLYPAWKNCVFLCWKRVEKVWFLSTSTWQRNAYDTWGSWDQDLGPFEFHMHKNPPPEECRTVQTANKFHKKKEEWSELEKMHTSTSQLWSLNQNTEGTCLMRLLGPEKIHISQKSR